jgi:hypothetical protein
MDMGSDAERASEASSNGSFSDILNSWNPGLNRSASDFDTRHLITLDWVYQLPLGHGRAIRWVVRPPVGCGHRRLAVVGSYPLDERIAI